MAQKTIEVKTSCHCKSFSYTLTLPSSTTLPLKSALCSCNSCRHVTGHLFGAFAVMPTPFPTNPTFFESLVKYHSTNNLSRYFCSKCGASVCNYDKSDEEWEFSTGVIDQIVDDDGKKGQEPRGPLDGKLDRALMWVSDTIDGGALPWIGAGKVHGFNGRFQTGRYAFKDGEWGRGDEVSDEMLNKMVRDNRAQSRKPRDKSLDCECHCGTVKFDILDPEDGKKYDGFPCACTSCRTTSGCEVTAWLRLSRENIRFPDGQQMQYGLRREGLSVYSSSKGVERYFCEKCGATVFFEKDDRNTTDIAVGLLNAPEGARAEQWLEWNPDGKGIHFEEDAIDKKFVKEFGEGAMKDRQQMK